MTRRQSPSAQEFHVPLTGTRFAYADEDMFPAPGATAPPDYGVIADVSATLVKLLTEGLGTAMAGVTAQLHDLQGSIPTTPARVTVFLFEVVEDPSARNRPRTPRRVGGIVETPKPPMTLLLRYMMTPWSGDRTTDHIILGRTLQLLYDNAIIYGPALQGANLIPGTDALKVTLAPLSLEDRSRVWHAVQKPYRLSLTYEVRVVNLNSTLVATSPPVIVRQLDVPTAFEDRQ